MELAVSVICTGVKTIVVLEQTERAGVGNSSSYTYNDSVFKVD